MTGCRQEPLIKSLKPMLAALQKYSKGSFMAYKLRFFVLLRLAIIGLINLTRDSLLIFFKIVI